MKQSDELEFEKQRSSAPHFIIRVQVTSTKKRHPGGWFRFLRLVTGLAQSRFASVKPSAAALIRAAFNYSSPVTSTKKEEA